MFTVVSPKCSRLSAMNLATKLGANFIMSDFKDESVLNLDKYIVLNFGSTRAMVASKLLTTQKAVQVAKNKLKTFSLLNGLVPIPEYTQDISTALDWIKVGHSVVCREFTSASKSKGTMIVSTAEELKQHPAKFWVKYVPHIAELRVITYKDKVIEIYEKVETDGFFEFKLINTDKKLTELDKFVKTVYSEIPLTIAGLDILLTEDLKYIMLEVNSAPTLFDSTIEKLVPLLQGEFA